MAQQVPAILQNAVATRRGEGPVAKGNIDERMAASRKAFIDREGEDAAAPLSADEEPSAAPKTTPSSPKPSFSSARAMEFSDAGGYVYLIDPSTKVIKITKAPESNKKAEGALLTATGKNQKAYAAIWAKYGDKVEQLASRSPLDIEVGDDVEEEIGEAPPDKFMSTRGMDGGPNAEAGRNARKSLLQTQFS